MPTLATFFPTSCREIVQGGIFLFGGAMIEKILTNEIIHSVGWDYFDELLDPK